ncbi:MAG: DUF1819 family protein [Eubacteriales bacterium]
MSAQGQSNSIASPYNGSGSLTREQFLFYEMRITAKLLSNGFSDEEVIHQILVENLFQYQTEKSLKTIARGCIRRLNSMNDRDLINAIANQPAPVSKQICLYAMMKQSRLVWDFMLTVIAEKYRTRDFSFGTKDLNVFFMRLQEQDDGVASWSSATIEKIKSVLKKVLVENEYLDNAKSEKLNPVLLSFTLENAIRSNNDEIVLPAFNCFG